MRFDNPIVAKVRPRRLDQHMLATRRCPAAQQSCHPVQPPGSKHAPPARPTPAPTQGYGFYVSVLYVLAAAILLSLLLCIWVGWCFKNDRFPAVW